LGFSPYFAKSMAKSMGFQVTDAASYGINFSVNHFIIYLLFDSTTSHYFIKYKLVVAQYALMFI
jgi:hypothetical protein